MIKKVGLPVLIGVVVGLLAGGTVAWSIIPSSTSGLISACYANSGPSKGILRVIDAQASQTCAAGESTLRWPSKSMRYLGAFNPATQYFVGDVVSDTGGAFVRVVAGVGGATSNSAIWAPLGGGGCGYPHPDAALAGCDFHGANLSNQNLSNANLSGANLSTADLSNANLNMANLSNANLNVASLFHATLVGSNLTGATVQSAFGAGADLTGADFTNADLTGAIFTSATGGDSAIWSNTTCPDGSNSDSNGGTCVGFGV